MGELGIHKVIAFIIPSSAEAGPDGASLDKWASRKFKVTLTKFEVSLDYMIWEPISKNNDYKIKY